MKKSISMTIAGAAAAAVLVTTALLSPATDSGVSIQDAYPVNALTATLTQGPTYLNDFLPTRTPTIADLKLGDSFSADGESMLLGGPTPSTWDWRSTIGAWPVRDQVNCGGGWAFATNAVMEGAIAITDVTAAPDLSEQYLISCNWAAYSCAGGGGPVHDMNGWMKGVGQTNSGAVLETDFPWSYGAACTGVYTKSYRNQGWVQLLNPTYQEIADAVYAHGPVYTSICAGPKFRRYVNGIFSSNETCTGGANHAVVIVGFNLDSGYWIIRNSYGAAWGESGYMRIAIGTSGVGQTISYVIYDGS